MSLLLYKQNRTLQPNLKMLYNALEDTYVPVHVNGFQICHPASAPLSGLWVPVMLTLVLTLGMV